MPSTENPWYRCNDCCYEGLEEDFKDEDSEECCCPECGSKNVSPDQE